MPSAPFTFVSALRREGRRAFLPVPLNLWEATGQKGNLPCRVSVAGCTFECKLLPKGGGFYWIPVGKVVLAALPEAGSLPVTLEILPSLSRIDHDSPYSRQHPIRSIEGIRAIPLQPGLCGQCCVAMLAGVSLPEVTALMGKGSASWAKILEALDYYGIAYAEKQVYPRGRALALPPCCIAGSGDSFLLWYKGAFCGAPQAAPAEITGWREIFLP